jgi:hypothetical protein
MNYKDEAKQIIKSSISNNSDNSVKAILMSLLEFSDYSCIALGDVRQIMSDILSEIEYPEIEEIEPYEDIYFNNVLQ